MYCLYTESTYTSRVRDDIEKFVMTDGEEAFVPVTARRMKIQKWVQEVMAPMFPGYIFISTDDDTGFFERLKSSLGKTIFRYVKLIRDNEYIIPLSNADEKIVTDLTDKEHVIRTSVGYLVGDRLTVTDGPLQGREGSVIYILTGTGGRPRWKSIFSAKSGT